MKIGVWLDADYHPEAGGGFSYYDKLVKAIDSYDFSEGLEFCFVSTGGIASLPLKRQKIQLLFHPKISFSERVKKHLPILGSYCREQLAQQWSVEENKSYIEQLKKCNVDVLYYLRQGEQHVKDFPFVATNWDIGHCSTYAFPELVSGGQYAIRHRSYTTLLPQALFVFAESEAGKSELIRYTKISSDKIKVVPIFAGDCIAEVVSTEKQLEILQQFGLIAQKYFFYPAQFWAHKNHIGLLYAFSEFLRKHSGYKLVLTGSDKGNLGYVRETVEKLGLNEAVVFPGFVPIATLNTFYIQSAALVMASFFGPTNMPPIEAMHLGCPVLCSDIQGHHELLGDAAIYFDTMKTETIVAAMEKIISDRDEYVRRLKHRAEQSVFTIEEALARINEYMLQLIPIRSTWK